MDKCPKCNANRRGGWGIYISVWDCGTSLTDNREVAQSEMCKAITELQTEIKRLQAIVA